jgi:hypothetical protein
MASFSRRSLFAAGFALIGGGRAFARRDITRPRPDWPPPGTPVPVGGALSYDDFLDAGGEIPAPGELALDALGAPEGPFSPQQATYTVLNLGPRSGLRARVRSDSPWLFLEPVNEDAPAQYDPAPDPQTGFVDRVYPPAEVLVPHAAQRLRVFYPDPARHVKPAAGWPFVLYCNAGSFLESLPFAQVKLGPQRLCYKLLERGIAVVSVGCVGINSNGLGPSPNLFHDQGTDEWNDFSLYWAEKDLTWAWLRIQYEAAGWNLDKTRGFVCGISSGSLVTSWAVLGPERGAGWADLDGRRKAGTLSPMLLESTMNCFGAVAQKPPAWWPAFRQDFAGWHFESATSPGMRAPTLAQAKPADLRAASMSTWIRGNGAAAATTPVLLAYDEQPLSANFSRDGQGNPMLADALDPDVTLHPYWSGIILRQDLLAVGPALQAAQGELWTRSGFEYASPYDLETGRLHPVLGTNSPQFQDAILRWILKRLGRDHVETTIPARAGASFTAFIDMHSVILPSGTHAETITVENALDPALATTFPARLEIT